MEVTPLGTHSGSRRIELGLLCQKRLISFSLMNVLTYMMCLYTCAGRLVKGASGTRYNRIPNNSRSTKEYQITADHSVHGEHDDLVRHASL